jgi:leader peptidase (prepilin peptidase)/N-methyltransferase
MTVLDEQTPLGGVTAARWALPAGAIAISAALAIVAGVAPTVYPFTLIAAVAIVGGLIAAYDARTFTLPNRFTGPFATAAAFQVGVVAYTTEDGWVLGEAAISAAVLFGVYAAMGFAGHVGFGDAKLAAGLGLVAAIPAGLGAIYILPAAILLASAARIPRLIARRPRKTQPHGPALVIATLLVMIAGLVHIPA